MKDNNKVGAPTKYKAEYIEQAYKLCLLGATDKEMADFFNVCEDTIYEWKNVYPEFSEVLIKGKLLADANVANSLYNRACGYETTEVKLAQMDGMFTDEKIVVKKYAPDPTSAIFWLKNRQPKKFRDKQEVQIEETRTIKVIKPKKKGEE